MGSILSSRSKPHRPRSPNASRPSATTPLAGRIYFAEIIWWENEALLNKASTMLKALVITACVPVMAMAIYQIAQNYRAAQASDAYRKAVMEQAHIEYQATQERRRSMTVDGSSPSSK
jgi:hypothetical protein